MTPDFGTIDRILDAAAARGDAVLVEPDGYPILRALGLHCPRHLLVRDAREVPPSGLPLPGDRVVVKAASSQILHRSDAGAVAVVVNHPAIVAAAIEAMARHVPRTGLRGFTINEFVPHDAGLGGELLLGLRWTDDFGPVVTLGAGGIHTELLAAHFRPGDDVAILPAFEVSRSSIERRLERLPVVRLLSGGLRGQVARVPLGAIADAVEAFAALGRAYLPSRIAECEVNPLAVGNGGLVALDVLVRTGCGAARPRAPRPLQKLARLLRPSRVAIAGVSHSRNPGRIILDNLLREGFPPDDLFIVKPGADRIDGCRCVPDLASLPGRVDLLVLAVSAAQVPGLIVECITQQKAESLVVIPGGLEEKAGTSDLLAPLYAALAASRETPWQGPIVNGGNCLGIRSIPGRIDTMFIPPVKMPARPDVVSPLALVSQSGAFAVAKASKLAALNPKFIVTVGNQMDLTVGDYLAYLKDDDDLDVFAVYVEGFRPLDGLQFLAAAGEIAARGKSVILYRAGRTAAGASASASHTASIAGDYAVTRELAASAGAVLADTLEDFEDLVTLFVALRGREPRGLRLGAVSNAGFECVAMADSLGAMSLAPLAPATCARLADALRAARIDALVDVHNPLDLTPMAGDATFEEAVRAVLDDEAVDVGLVGCVPLTAALQTLPPSEAHGENVFGDASIAMRLARLVAGHPKPWVVVIDGGRQYDPMADVLARAGVPVFRAADRAMRLLNVYCAARQRRGQEGTAPRTARHAEALQLQRPTATQRACHGA
jgi:acyl-CoA synthetase (NDP forming)